MVFKKQLIDEICTEKLLQVQKIHGNTADRRPFTFSSLEGVKSSHKFRLLTQILLKFLALPFSALLACAVPCSVLLQDTASGSGHP